MLEQPRFPDGTTAEFFRYANGQAQLTEKERHQIESGDPNAPRFPLKDGTTAKLFQLMQKEGERVGQFTNLL